MSSDDEQDLENPSEIEEIDVNMIDSNDEFGLWKDIHEADAKELGSMNQMGENEKSKDEDDQDVFHDIIMTNE